MITIIRWGLLLKEIRFAKDLDEPVSSIMTPREKLVTVSEDASQGSIKKKLHESIR